MVQSKKGYNRDYPGGCEKEMKKEYINENYSTNGITVYNTEGFTDEMCTRLNEELFERLKSDELSGIPDEEREKIISEEILGRY